MGTSLTERLLFRDLAPAILRWRILRLRVLFAWVGLIGGMVYLRAAVEKSLLNPIEPQLALC